MQQLIKSIRNINSQRCTLPRCFLNFVAVIKNLKPIIALAWNLPIIKNGAARLIPMNSMPKYMANPNAAAVAMLALTFPKSPSHGFDRTVSPIMHVSILWMEQSITATVGLKTICSSYLKTAININVDPKKGTTVWVFFSSSWSSVREANLATEMCLKWPVSS